MNTHNKIADGNNAASNNAGSKHIEGDHATSPSPLPESASLSRLLVRLLKGVIYKDNAQQDWANLLLLQNRVRDYVGILGLELTLDEAEAYAFLRTRQADAATAENEEQEAVPRLIIRHQLSFPVSLLLALLRKKLAEFDASGAETRLVLNRSELVDLIRLFLPDSSNETRLVDQIERHINKIIELGFLRRLQTTTTTSEPAYEVRRIIKAFVDAQWLAALDDKLAEYQQHLIDTSASAERQASRASS